MLMKKVLIVEDQTILRDLLMRLIESIPGYEVLQTVGDGSKGVEACEKLHPDMLILDMMLPGLHGIEVLRRLKKLCPRTRILVFTSNYSTQTVKHAMELGVDGFLEKDAGIDQLEIAIRHVGEGQTFYGPQVVSAMSDLLTNAGRAYALDTLSGREREILKLIAESKTSKEIAALLGISQKTVDTHRVNIMGKVNVHDIAGLTRFAISNGLVEA